MEAALDSPHRIRVLIADDHRLFGQALEAILATDDRLEVSGHAGDGAEAVQLALSIDPDVILMDIAMPIMDGFEATRQIRRQRPGSCVLMLTGSINCTNAAIDCRNSLHSSSRSTRRTKRVSPSS